MLLAVYVHPPVYSWKFAFYVSVFSASCGLVGSAVSAMLWFSLRLKGKWSALIDLQYLIAQID